MNTTFRGMFNTIRRKIRAASPREFNEAKARHCCLARHATVFSVLAVMEDESPDRWMERETITRVLIAEYQSAPSSFWASVLLVAFFPMLCRLRNRILGEAFDRDDLNQFVLLRFLQVAASFPLDEIHNRTALRLRQCLERRVFKAIRHEQHEQQQASPIDPKTLDGMDIDCEEMDRKWRRKKRRKIQRGPGDASEAADLVSLLLEYAGSMLDGETFDLVTATVICGRRIPVSPERLVAGPSTDTKVPNPSADKKDLSSDMREREYQRVKRRHGRALKRIRPLFEPLRCVQVERDWI